MKYVDDSIAQVRVDGSGRTQYKPVGDVARDAASFAA